MQTDKLDNPAWHSLNETHHDFAVRYHDIHFYHPDYCPFGGFLNSTETEKGIQLYASLTDNFFIVGDKPSISRTLYIKHELVCHQMILDKETNVEITENITDLQTDIQRKNLFTLVNLVQPGYFKEKTADLGNYYGIYKDNVLAAVAGERMKMNGYTELSAIITHPEHSGRGFAKQLISHAAKKISDRGNIPYLHVARNNLHAVKLYDKLGFVTRKDISFWNIGIT